MKLLFDHNLSRRLIGQLADLFPESSHVSLLGLERSEDRVVWNYARAKQFLLVTKDVDFSELNTLEGFPPKVIWIRVGNCTTTQIETLLRGQYEAIEQFNLSEDLGILSLL